MHQIIRLTLSLFSCLKMHFFNHFSVVAWKHKHKTLDASWKWEQHVKRNLEVISCLKQNPIMILHFLGAYPHFCSSVQDYHPDLMASVGCSWPISRILQPTLPQNSQIWEFSAGFCLVQSKPHAHVGWLPSTLPSQSIHACLHAKYAAEMIIKIRRWMAVLPRIPLRLGKQIKVCHEKLCVPSRRGPILEYVNRFIQSLGGKEKDALFNVKLFPI